MRILIVAAFALAVGTGSALAECAWMQTAAKSSVVAKSEQSPPAAASTAAPRS